jgi:hypothetical protein
VTVVLPLLIVSRSYMEALAGLRGPERLFAALTLSEDRGVEALAESIRQLIDLVAAIDLDGLASGMVSDFAVVTLAEVLC